LSYLAGCYSVPTRLALLQIFFPARSLHRELLKGQQEWGNVRFPFFSGIDMTSAFVAILMGSDSDLPVMQACSDLLDSFGVTYEMRITSAHRTPEDTRNYVREAEERGCAVFIAAAGLAAHLAGAVAAQTVRPVIGVPIDSGPLQGIDALLSTVQMPGGIPVASVAIGKSGAKNAAYLATQILATNDAGLKTALEEERARNAESIRQKNRDLNS
jgi:phosphoribosylaminoimidazole carboxylase PurE protein